MRTNKVLTDENRARKDTRKDDMVEHKRLINLYVERVAKGDRFTAKMAKNVTVFATVKAAHKAALEAARCAEDKFATTIAVCAATRCIRPRTNLPLTSKSAPTKANALFFRRLCYNRLHARRCLRRRSPTHHAHSPSHSSLTSSVSPRGGVCPEPHFYLLGAFVRQFGGLCVAPQNRFGASFEKQKDITAVSF